MLMIWITLIHIKYFLYMHNKLKRIHPGLILKMELVDGRSLTVSKIAELLDTTRSNMSNIINGKAAISPSMALRLEKVFGGSAMHFIKLQSAYDLSVAIEQYKRNPPNIKKYSDVAL